MITGESGSQTLSASELRFFIDANAEGLDPHEHKALCGLFPGESVDIGVHDGWLRITLAQPDYAVDYVPPTMVGIPFAAGTVGSDEGPLALLATCPECGKVIECTEAKDDESFTKREYADHYASEHMPPVLSVDGFELKRGAGGVVSLEHALDDGRIIALTNEDGSALPEPGEDIHISILDAGGNYQLPEFDFDTETGHTLPTRICAIVTALEPGFTVVDAYKEEIIDDVVTGRVPDDVANFGDLHNYVDANMYGEEHPAVKAEWVIHQLYGERPYEDLDARETAAFEGWMGFKNEAIEAIDEWIQSGGIGKHPFLRAHLTAADKQDGILAAIVFARAKAEITADGKSGVGSYAALDGVTAVLEYGLDAYAEYNVRVSSDKYDRIATRVARELDEWLRNQ